MSLTWKWLLKFLFIYSAIDALVVVLKNNIKIYIKINIQIAPTLGSALINALPDDGVTITPKHVGAVFFLTFCWPCISVYLSQYLTNLMHKICFTVGFISCLYMFRAYVLIIRRSKLHYTASGIITPIGVMIPEAV